jgi:hypothetical protein
MLNRDRLVLSIGMQCTSVYLDGGDEAVSVITHGPEIDGTFVMVPQGFSDPLDVKLHSAFEVAHRLARPKSIAYFIPRYKVIGMGKQQLKKLKRVRRKINPHAITPQFVVPRIKLEDPKLNDDRATSVGPHYYTSEARPTPLCGRKVPKQISLSYLPCQPIKVPLLTFSPKIHLELS